MNRTTAAITLSLSAGLASAQIVALDFQGNAGFGLLPGNEIGANTPVGLGLPSAATGGEAGDGLLYNVATNQLSFSFQFAGLTGGLFNAATGIHFHLVAPGVDPFGGTGPIVFNLNSGTDPNVLLATELLATDGSVTSGTVTGVATLTEEQETALFAGRFYLNIHSGAFTGGELRANIVPAPASLALAGLVGGLASRRRRA